MKTLGTWIMASVVAASGCAAAVYQDNQLRRPSDILTGTEHMSAAEQQAFASVFMFIPGETPASTLGNVGQGFAAENVAALPSDANIDRDGISAMPRAVGR